MAEISPHIAIGFILTTIITLYFFYKSVQSKKVILGIIVWMIIVGIFGFSGFYREVDKIPPRFVFLLGPGIVFVILFFLTQKSKPFSTMANLKWLTLLHIVRAPVEIVLYYVFLAGYIPDLMTFEGYNFDILSGLSAPLVYYLVFVKKSIGRIGLLVWNFICLGLLINILTIAVLSAQTPIQKLAFEQPNIGVTYFPLVWLPAVIVPIVLFSHLASIKQLLASKKEVL